MTVKKNDDKDPGRPDRPPIDERIEAELGEQLRAAFSDVFNEPVPERFRQLIQSLSKGRDR